MTFQEKSYCFISLEIGYYYPLALHFDDIVTLKKRL